MSAIDAAVRSFRFAALTRERAASAQLVAAYADLWGRLRPQLAALNADIADAEARGETVSRAWLERQARYRSLLAQTEEELRRYALFAESVVTAQSREAVTAALVNVERVMGAALGTPPPGVAVSFNRLPTAAIEELTGALSDGSPLSALFREIAPTGAQAASEALVTGLGRGLGPRAIAREVRQALNVAPVRALRISRNEINRAYRNASLETYKANRDLLEGWVWVCAGGVRTCGVCFAKHGTLHPVDEPFASHISCRCAAVARTKSWDALGFSGMPDTRPAIEDGDALFARLPAEDQRTILGPGKYQLFKAGELALDDLVKRTRSAQWGPGLRESTLGELRERGLLAAD